LLLAPLRRRQVRHLVGNLTREGHTGPHPGT
jgi:hypothetical protein